MIKINDLKNGATMAFNLFPIPALNDNYIWAIYNQEFAILVDVGDANAANEFLKTHQLELVAILITHAHHDHIGGILNLINDKQHISIYGPPQLAWVTHHANESEPIDIPQLGISFQVFEVPAHTKDHLAYFGGGILFSGDTLFASGCGRLFEGDAEDLARAFEKFSSLPDETLLCCAHEYTLSNQRFARMVDPKNQALKQAFERNLALRAQHLPTLPTTLKEERACNPFLRVHDPDIRAAVSTFLHRNPLNEIEILGALREWKNQS